MLCHSLAGCDSSKGADIVFVLDGSGSIGSHDFEEVKEFVKSVCMLTGQMIMANLFRRR